MRNKIMIVSHGFHTFLLNEIAYASEIFDEVVLISSEEEQLNQIFKGYPNVKLELFNKTDLKRNAFLSISELVNEDVRTDIAKAMKGSVCDLVYFKSLFLYLGLERIVKRIASSYGVFNEAENWVLMSAWYSAAAYAVYCMKRDNPSLKIISLAHSYEIDKRKTKYNEVLFRSDYCNSFDLTSFISKNVYNEFFRDYEEKLNLNQSLFDVQYLGTKKLFQGTNPGNPDDCIKIVSCSHVVPVKRLELILDAIATITERQVVWYHIGDGVLLEELKKKALDINNENISIHFYGSLKNRDVQKLFRFEAFDIFINVSSSEGIPVSIMEALAYGLPVIATNVGGNSEIIDNECGYLLDSNPSIEDIKSTILAFKNLDSSQILRLKNNALEKYQSTFNSDLIRNNFYKEIASL